MKLKLSRFSSLVFLLFIFIGVQAQASVQTHLQNEEQVTFSLDKLRKLSFDTEYMYVTLEDDTNYSYNLINMSSALFFTDIGTDVTVVEESINFELRAFPNPVADVLNILLPGTGTADGLLTLYNDKGQVVKQLDVRGETYINIDVSRLQRGLYLCSYRSEGVNKSVKFIKN